MFEPPKILGDIFESLVGAIFIDGGIEKVIEVFQHLLSPFILFIAKFNKKLFKEPKDEFNTFSNQVKIKPDWRHTEVELADTIESFISALS